VIAGLRGAGSEAGLAAFVRANRVENGLTVLVFGCHQHRAVGVCSTLGRTGRDERCFLLHVERQNQVGPELALDEVGLVDDDEVGIETALGLQNWSISGLEGCEKK